MKDPKKNALNLRLMETDFQLACETSEKEAILDSAERLNSSLREFRKNNPELDNERSLLLGALYALTTLNQAYLQQQTDITLTNAWIAETLASLSPTPTEN